MGDLLYVCGTLLFFGLLLLLVRGLEHLGARGANGARHER